MKRFNCFYIMAIAPAIVCGQQSLNIIDLYHDFQGDIPARSIRANANIGTYAFHEGIGGIAFESIAVPSGAGVTHISLDYDSGGFSVAIDNLKIYPPLPDWQLIPTAVFADSPDHVLFSPLGDAGAGREARCKYHPALLNTLAGLRLFEADMLNLPHLLWDLPKDRNGEYILAGSEQFHVPCRNDTIEQKLYDELCGDIKPFSSYVLTDKDANISFDIQDGMIRFTGNPYYLFTKNASDMDHINNLKRELAQVYADIEAYAERLLGSKYSPILNPRTNLGGLLKAVEDNRSEKAFNPYAAHAVAVAISKLDSLNSLSDAEIGLKLDVLYQYSAAFNENWPLLKAYNPPVYETVENIAWWAAFFRYVKQTNPVNWSGFIKKVAGRTVKDAPDVYTPTSYDINYFKMIRE
ncbi:MAG: hypothetical protein LBE71_06125 [Dysgonamonadaceae bacterium]|jgi:hypothetical protein|nr:hypothetical protein [Dysgonamonadaceae bacterium]